MKIPQFQYSAVPKSEQVSTSQIAAGARSQMRGPTQQLVKVATQFGEKVAAAEAETEYFRVTRGLKAEASAAWDDIQSQDQYDENGAPTYDQMESQFQERYKKISDKYAGQIKWNQNRSAFSEASIDAGFEFDTAVRKTVRGRQVEHLRAGLAQDMQGLELDIENGVALAAERLESARATDTISPEEYARMSESFTKMHDDNRIRVDMQEARTNLRGDLDAMANYTAGYQFPEYMGQVDKDKYTGYLNTLVTRDYSLNQRRKNEAESAARVANTQQYNQVKDAMSLMLSGVNLPDDTLVSVQEFASGTDIEGNTDDERRSAAKFAVDSYNLFQQVKGMSFSEMQATLESTYAQQPDLYNTRLAVAAQAMASKMISDYGTDPVNAAKKYGAVSPLSMSIGEATEGGQLDGYFAEVMSRNAQISDQMGKDAPFFSKVEADEIIASGVDGLISMSQSFSKEDIPRAMKEIYDGKGQRPYEMAQVAMMAQWSDGMPNVNMYLDGERVLKNSPELKPTGQDKAGKNAHEIYTGLVGDVFIGNPEMNATVKGIAEKMYASLKAQASDYTDNFDSELYAQAVTRAMGGRVEFEDQVIVPPVIGMTTDQFKRAVELALTDVELPPVVEAYSVDGTIELDSDGIKQLIIDGRFQFINTGQRGVYMLVNGDAVLMGDNNKPFELDLRND